MVFKTTPAKDLIREYDKQIVGELSKHLGYKLSYFGLPGALMLDIISWRDHLRFSTAVERDEDLLRHRLLTTAFRQGLDGELQLLCGDIDQIMLDWKDRYSVAPALQAYDIVNLDYEGGLVYKDLEGGSKRMAAIKKMIERQARVKRGFLLLMTVNTRNRDCDEFDNAMKDIEEQLLEYGILASRVVDWYRGQGYDRKLKVYLPYVFDSVAAINRFAAKYHPPVTYLGSSSRRMVHFAVEMEYDETRAGRSKSLSLLQILNLPLREIVRASLSNVVLEIISAGS